MKGDTCGKDHVFVWLRQERRNTGFDRNPVWLVEDVFCCSRCLEHRRVAVEQRTPKQDSFTEEHVVRLV